MQRQCDSETAPSAGVPGVIGEVLEGHDHDPDRLEDSPMQESSVQGSGLLPQEGQTLTIGIRGIFEGVYLDGVETYVEFFMAHYNINPDSKLLEGSTAGLRADWEEDNILDLTMPESQARRLLEQDWNNPLIAELPKDTMHWNLGINVERFESCSLSDEGAGVEHDRAEDQAAEEDEIMERLSREEREAQEIQRMRESITREAEEKAEANRQDIAEEYRVNDEDLLALERAMRAKRTVTTKQPQVLKAEWTPKPKIAMLIGGLLTAEQNWTVRNIVDKLRTSNLPKEHLSKTQLLVAGTCQTENGDIWIRTLAEHDTAEKLVQFSWDTAITIMIPPGSHLEEQKKSENVSLITSIDDNLMSFEVPPQKTKTKTFFTADGLGQDNQLISFNTLIKKHLQLQQDSYELIKILPRGGLLCKAPIEVYQKLSSLSWPTEDGICLKISTDERRPMPGVPMTVYGVDLHISPTNLIEAYKGKIKSAERLIKQGRPLSMLNIRVSSEVVAQELVSRGVRLGHQRFKAARYIDKKAVCKICKQLLRDHKAEQCFFKCGNCGQPHATKECQTSLPERRCQVCLIPGHDFAQCPTKRQVEKEQVRQKAKSYRDAALLKFPKVIAGSNRNTLEQHAQHRPRTQVPQWQLKTRSNVLDSREHRDDTAQEREELRRRAQEIQEEKEEALQQERDEWMERILDRKMQAMEKKHQEDLQLLKNDNKRMEQVLALLITIVQALPSLNTETNRTMLSQIGQTLKDTETVNTERTLVNPDSVMLDAETPAKKRVRETSRSEDEEETPLERGRQQAPKIHQDKRTKTSEPKKRTNRIKPLSEINWDDTNNGDWKIITKCPAGFDPQSAINCPNCEETFNVWQGFALHKRSCIATQEQEGKTPARKKSRRTSSTGKVQQAISFKPAAESVSTSGSAASMQPLQVGDSPLSGQGTSSRGSPSA